VIEDLDFFLPWFLNFEKMNWNK